MSKREVQIHFFRQNLELLLLGTILILCLATLVHMSRVLRTEKSAPAAMHLQMGQSNHQAPELGL